MLPVEQLKQRLEDRRERVKKLEATIAFHMRTGNEKGARRLESGPMRQYRDEIADLENLLKGLDDGE